MTIFTYSLKRLLRNKVNVLLMLVLPALMTGVIFGFAGTGMSTLTVGVVDNDNTPLTQELVESLSQALSVVLVEEEDIRRALANNRAQYILVIESGFTQELLELKQPNLAGYSIQESNMAMPAKVKIQSFLNAAYNLAEAADGDAQAFYQGLEYYQDGNFALNLDYHGGQRRDPNETMGGMGLLAMSMLYLGTLSTFNLLKDKEARTFYRVLSTSVSLKSYMLQSIMSYLTILLMQVFGSLLVVYYVFGIYLGPSIPNLIVVMVVFAIVCVSLGVALSAMAKNSRQAGVLTTLLITPMCMLGGLFWPREIMPDLLQKIGQLLPTAWIMDAVNIVVLGNPLTDAWKELSILLAFALMFFLLGSWRKADISK